MYEKPPQNPWQLRVSVASALCVALSSCINFDEAREQFCEETHDCPELERHIFSKRLGGSGLEVVHALAVMAQGEAVLGGLYTGSAQLGGDTLPEGGQSDLFLARYSAEGEHLSSFGTGGSGNELVRTLALDAFGEIYAAG